MASSGLRPSILHAVSTSDHGMTATLYGIDMNWHEAMAYQAIAANIGTQKDAQTLRGWCVKAALIGDVGTAEEIEAWVSIHLGNVSPS